MQRCVASLSFLVYICSARKQRFDLSDVAGKGSLGQRLCWLFSGPGQAFEDKDRVVILACNIDMFAVGTDSDTTG